MDKATLLETLVMSEKNHSIVEIKVINNEKLIIGAVQKVLNQIIILKPATAEPITLTFADIESVTDRETPFLAKFFKLSRKHYT